MDTVSLLSEISILKRYIEWLEASLASYEPDWICDKMGDKDLCHDWCYDNCGTEAWTHDCFKKYYDNFVADHKTENSSEKPNNCEDLQDWKDRMWAEAIVTEPTISKMEQVDKPQTCDTCKYGEDKHRYAHICNECGVGINNYEPKDEPQMGDAKPIPLSNRVTHIKDEPQPQSLLEAYFKMMNEPQTERSE